jgi:ferritin-like metal-binding protein YciE
MAIATPRELFVHELADAMSAEQQLLKMLPELQQEALHPELKSALKEHEHETKGHVKNLQGVFKQLGEQPEETT